MTNPYCKHIRSAVIGLAHALCRGTWQARRCVVIVLVLRNSGCTTVYNKSKLTVTEAHTITLHSLVACQRRNISNISRSFRFLPILPKNIINQGYSEGRARGIKRGDLLYFCLRSIEAVLAKSAYTTDFMFTFSLIIVWNTNNRAFSEVATCELPTRVF